MKSKLTRRRFLGDATTAAAAIGLPTIVAARALGKDGQKPPSERITVGLIGTGGIARGQAHYGGPHAQVVALCDVNRQRRLEFKEKFDYGGCQDYNDFRDLLARNDVDAVHVSTPDHWHVPMAVLAAKAGKHMHIEKPLAMSIGELLALKKVLAGKELVFQFGTEDTEKRPPATEPRPVGVDCGTTAGSCLGARCPSGLNPSENNQE